jgi:hypothetical protein
MASPFNARLQYLDGRGYLTRRQDEMAWRLG